VRTVLTLAALVGALGVAAVVWLARLVVTPEQPTVTVRPLSTTTDGRLIVRWR
jgi:hypothetical protein